MFSFAATRASPGRDSPLGGAQYAAFSMLTERGDPPRVRASADDVRHTGAAGDLGCSSILCRKHAPTIGAHLPAGDDLGTGMTVFLAAAKQSSERWKSPPSAADARWIHASDGHSRFLENCQDIGHQVVPQFDVAPSKPVPGRRLAREGARCAEIESPPARVGSEGRIVPGLCAEGPRTLFLSRESRRAQTAKSREETVGNPQEKHLCFQWDRWAYGVGLAIPPRQAGNQ